MSKQQESQPTYRALDLGYGYTKFSKGHYLDDTTVDVGAFPSYAVRSVDSLGSDRLGVIQVKVDAAKFWVGEQVRYAADGRGRQLLEASFFGSSQYLALAKGALAFMNVPREDVIDALVMGLPNDLMGDDDLIAYIKASIGGDHVVPNIKEPGAQRTIRVKKVKIIPQVVGSLIALSREAGLVEKVEKEQNLTIDTGYGTVLWLVTKGFIPLRARCGSNMGGVSALLQEIATNIDVSVTSNINILHRIDTALLNNESTIMVYGQDVSLAKFHDIQRFRAKESITDVMRELGSIADLDNIFLTGGGSYLFKAAVAAAFPKHKVNFAAHGSRFTNVLGFQFLAETDN